MKKIINWLIKSSEDPSKVALTAKGFVLANAALVAFVYSILHVTTDGQTVNTLAENVGIIVTAGLTIVGAGVTLFGLARKAYNSFKKK